MNSSTTIFPLKNYRLIDKESGYLDRLYSSHNSVANDSLLYLRISSVDEGRVVELRLFSVHQLLFSYTCRLSCFHWKSSADLRRLSGEKFERLFTTLVDVFHNYTSSNELINLQLSMLPGGRLSMRVEEVQTLSGDQRLFTITSFRLSDQQEIERHFLHCYHHLDKQLIRLHGQQVELMDSLRQHNAAILLAVHRNFHNHHRDSASNTARTDETRVPRQHRWTDVYQDLQQQQQSDAILKSSQPLPISPELKRLFGTQITTNSIHSVLFNKTIRSANPSSSCSPDMLLRLCQITDNAGEMKYHLEISQADSESSPLERYRTVEPLQPAAIQHYQLMDPSGKTLVPWLSALFQRCSTWTADDATVPGAVESMESPVLARNPLLPGTVRLTLRVSGLPQSFYGSPVDTAVNSDVGSPVKVEVIEVGRWRQATILCFTLQRLSTWQSLGELQIIYKQKRSRLSDYRKQIDGMVEMIKRKSPALLLRLNRHRRIMDNETPYGAAGGGKYIEDQYIY